MYTRWLRDYLGMAMETGPGRSEKKLILRVYSDAVGRANEKRLWGLLATLGDDEDRFLGEALAQIKQENQLLLEPSGELKGKTLKDDTIQLALDKIKDRSIYFFPRYYPELHAPEVSKFGE